MDDATPVVSVESLSRSYPSSAGEVHAVRDVSFEIPRGQLVALVGRSGSGKTTSSTASAGSTPPPPAAW